LPEAVRNNKPGAIERTLKPAVDSGLLATFPFGTDFTEIERQLLPALQRLKSASLGRLVVYLMWGVFSRSENRSCLDRLDLAAPKSPREWLYSLLVRGALVDRC
jgi:hypothetical protein